MNTICVNSSFIIDINECDDKTDICSDNAVCSDTDGSYSCTCKPGYVGDGFSCLPTSKELCLVILTMCGLKLTKTYVNF